MTFVRFGLIVTGRGEAKFLPMLFRAIMAAASCTFELIRKSEQLSPITSEKRILRMVGRGQVIPTIDQEQFGLAALSFLRKHPSSFVLVVDDLEGARRDQATAVYARYRAALDEVLAERLSRRASVHFLVNMLEAYYFAHSEAVNVTAKRIVLPGDHASDVETIRHPKNELKAIWAGFDEVDHGKDIIAILDLPHVLRTPDHCCWLRSLFAWCVARLVEQDAIFDDHVHELFQLREGCRVELLANQ